MHESSPNDEREDFYRPEDPILSVLRARRRKLEGTLSKARDDRRTLWILSFAFFVLTLAVQIFITAPILYIIPKESITGMLFLFTLIFLIASFTISVWRTKKEIEDLENEEDLVSLSSFSPEQKAQKLLRIQQISLQRYYDQILDQSRSVYWVGCICLLLGFLVIVSTFYFIIPTGTSTDLGATAYVEKVILGTMGIISGIMTNYIGSTYIKMFSDIVKTAGESFGRMANFHEFAFRNVLASGIDDDNLRRSTISDLAKK